MSNDSKPSSARGLAYVSALFALFIATSAVLHVSVAFSKKSEFVALDNYSIQTVDNITHDTVTVSGTKCQTYSEPIDIVGEFNWFRVVPPGYGTTPVGGFQRGVLPGCKTYTWTNTIPAEVLRVNKPGDVWFITGTEWPIDPDTGKRGQQITWVTENFSLE